MIKPIILVTLIDMITEVHSETYLLYFLPIMMGVIGFHIGSKNSTANGIAVGGLAGLTTTFLFATFDNVILNGLVIGAIAVAIGLVSIFFFNKQRK